MCSPHQGRLVPSEVASLMTTIIIHDLTNWYNNDTTPFPFHHYPEDRILQHLQHASQQQQILGWHNFLRGRIATAWFTAHDQYHHERHLHVQYSSTTLAPQLVLHLWDTSRTFWRHRNEAIHGPTIQEAYTTQQALIQAKIITAYQTPATLTPQDQTLLFTLPLANRLSTTLQAQIQWYALYQICLNAPPEPTDTPPPTTTTLHNFFRRFLPRYFPPQPNPASNSSTPPPVHNPNQQPANLAP